MDQEEEIFNQFMELMKPFMKSHGFTKKNNNFYKRHPQGNIGIINFQKYFSKFTINISIYSYILAEAFLAEFGEKEVKKYPSEWDGHWRTRIDSLVPKQSPECINLANSKSIEKGFADRWPISDWWWRCYYVTSSDTICEVDAKELFDEVSPLIAKFAIPAIDQRITDEQLKSLLFSYKKPNSDDLQYLATFFLASGEEEKLNIVLNKLGKIVQNNPQSTGLKRKYDTFMRERRWIDEAYAQELERERELYRSKKRKKKQ
ncbi:DUF4304 domain-containing protein [Candidatus Mesenet endosymbiont of Agriotes lineatus]|uniref:DUF4304 domain-containing protein n=1 Tax=Candidatus Mesenet endosymbiont of Agriotes lineatus TaxID=3077948 RepID=UPI0030D49D64